MKKWIYGSLIAAFFSIVWICFPVEASSEDIPPYVEIPDRGEYTMGGEDRAGQKGSNMELGTDFYLYVENPGSHRHHDSDSESSVVIAPAAAAALPKTGDYGMDMNTLLFLALFCGTGYLFCEYYEKKES